MARASEERPPRLFVAGGEAIRVRVRESRRARLARIAVGRDGRVELVVPQRVPGRALDELLERNRAWIERRLAALQAVAAGPRLGLDRSGTVWLGGEAIPLERENGHRPGAALRDGRLLVAGPDDQAAAAIERWYRREARRTIAAIAGREAERLGVRFASIAIRDQRTRWGSCSATGGLSFSWRLLLAPRGVLEYVVVHELCHLRERNHSRAFWRLVEEARPGWRAEARWLREHGGELQSYVPRP